MLGWARVDLPIALPPQRGVAAEKGKDDKNFPEGDGLQQISCDCGKPFSTVCWAPPTRKFREVGDFSTIALAQGNDAA